MSTMLYSASLLLSILSLYNPTTVYSYELDGKSNSHANIASQCDPSKVQPGYLALNLLNPLTAHRCEDSQSSGNSNTKTRKLLQTSSLLTLTLSTFDSTYTVPNIMTFSTQGPITCATGEQQVSTSDGIYYACCPANGSTIDGIAYDFVLTEVQGARVTELNCTATPVPVPVTTAPTTTAPTTASTSLSPSPSPSPSPASTGHCITGDLSGVIVVPGLDGSDNGFSLYHVHTGRCIGLQGEGLVQYADPSTIPVSSRSSYTFNLVKSRPSVADSYTAIKSSSRDDLFLHFDFDTGCVSHKVLDIDPHCDCSNKDNINDRQYCWLLPSANSQKGKWLHQHPEWSHDKFDFVASFEHWIVEVVSRLTGNKK